MDPVSFQQALEHTVKFAADGGFAWREAWNDQTGNSYDAIDGYIAISNGTLWYFEQHKPKHQYYVCGSDVNAKDWYTNF